MDEAGIIWNDKELSINWPTESPILSDKDTKLPPLREANIRFNYQEEK